MVRRIALILALTPACDPPEQTPAQKQAAAKADAESAAKKAKEDLHRLQREQEAAAQEVEEKRHAAKINALAVLPDAVPKKLEDACKQMLDAYDKFMLSTLEGDMKTKWETGGNEMQLAVFRKECLKRSPKVAACQANALGSLPVEMKTDLATVMERCAAKFGADAKEG